MRVRDDAIQVNIESTLAPSLAAYYLRSTHGAGGKNVTKHNGHPEYEVCYPVHMQTHSPQPNGTHGLRQSLRTARIKQGTIFSTLNVLLFSFSTMSHFLDPRQGAGLMMSCSQGGC